MVKYPLTVDDTGVADMVRVTAWEEGPLSEAVTLAAPPFSLMEDELRLSVTVGMASSSMIVSVTDAGPDAPNEFVAVADTKTLLLGASTLLSTPVMVTVPLLVVDPGAMVRVLLDVMVKFPLTAGDNGDTETTTVTAWEEGALSEAVTLALPPFSLMEDELRLSVTLGVASSSVMVRVWLEGALTP